MDADTYAALDRLRNKVISDRERELVRATQWKAKGGRPNDVRAAYHTGCADGRNDLAQQLWAVMQGVKVTTWSES